MNWFNLTWHFCPSIKQATTKINLAVEKVPHFPCKFSPSEAGHQLVGTIHIGAERYVKSIPSSCYLHLFYIWESGGNWYSSSLCFNKCKLYRTIRQINIWTHWKNYVLGQECKQNSRLKETVVRHFVSMYPCLSH